MAPSKKKIITSRIIFIGLVFLMLVIFGIVKDREEAGSPILNNNLKNKIEDNMEEISIRPPAVAGGFYPDNAQELKSLIKDFLSKAVREETAQDVKILIVPHAGYVYSGQVAAFSFKQINPEAVDKVIILGPSHHFPVRGIYSSGATHWQTPLGEVKVFSTDWFTSNPAVHSPEHSLEVEIPFLQVVFGSREFEILPLIVGYLTDSEREIFVKQLQQLLDNRTLLVVSVDLSHYHPYDEAVKMDQKSIDTILSLDEKGVADLEIDSPDSIKTIIQLAKIKGWRPKLLKYANSGEVTGDQSAVVGYSAIGFYEESSRSKARSSAVDKNKVDNYTDEEKQELLAVARQTLEMYLNSNQIYQPSTTNPKFQQNRGVFVTLNKHGNLRGCIGYIESIKPLIEAVRDNVISAAVNDSRFMPVTADELDDIEIEISILTVPQKTTLDKITVGKDGVVIKRGGYQATYLPQVWESLPTLESFFGTLCEKAGLKSNCWQEPETEFYSYQAVVFGEKS